jgi:hypothetical protein
MGVMGSRLPLVALVILPAFGRRHRQRLWRELDARQ